MHPSNPRRLPSGWMDGRAYATLRRAGGVEGTGIREKMETNETNDSTRTFPQHPPPSFHIRALQIRRGEPDAHALAHMLDCVGEDDFRIVVVLFGRGRGSSVGGRWKGRVVIGERKGEGEGKTE